MTAAESGQVAAPPGGRALALAKRGAEHALWARVASQRRLEARRGTTRPAPTGVLPSAVLQTRDEAKAAVAQARRLRLPLHRDRVKNWDALGAVGAVLTLASGEGGLPQRVMDAGSARYSPILPWLRLYGLGATPGGLIGTNLEFGAPVLRDGVVFRYGDVTATGMPDGHLDAITCMSVIEHGVPLAAFLRESARILRPGGILVISTDYDYEPPDTRGKVAYGVPVHIFGPAQIRALISDAAAVGLDLVGELTDDDLRHPERPCHWERVDLDYTFILLTFRRR